MGYQEYGGRSLIEDPTHWFRGPMPMVRTALQGSRDPVITKTAAELPPATQKEAHREIEQSYQLSKPELEHAMGVLEGQKAQIIMKGEITQFWYDTSDICARFHDSVSLATLSVCNSMQVRVRSVKTEEGTTYYWAVKLPGSNSAERIELEDQAHSWDDALTALNKAITQVLAPERFFDEPLPLITANTKTAMELRKARVSYRFEDRTNGKQYPCAGSQIDFDVWTHAKMPEGEKTGDVDNPLLITVDVEGPVLNGNAAGLSAEEAKRVASVENCVDCLSFAGREYDLFPTMRGIVSGRG